MSHHIYKDQLKDSHVYKWKDNHHLTIDFKIEFVQRTNSREYVYIDNNKYLKAKLKTRKL